MATVVFTVANVQAPTDSAENSKRIAREILRLYKVNTAGKNQTDVAPNPVTALTVTVS